MDCPLSRGGTLVVWVQVVGLKQGHSCLTRLSLRGGFSGPESGLMAKGSGQQVCPSDGRVLQAVAPVPGWNTC